MFFRALVIFFGVLVSPSALIARDCTTVHLAIEAINRAETKQAVADELKKLGAPAESADSLARTSPDVSVAQKSALRTLHMMLRTCKT